MAKSKKVFVGWVVIERSKTGIWKPRIDTTGATRRDSIAYYVWRLGYWKTAPHWTKRKRADTVRVKKMWVTM